MIPRMVRPSSVSFKVAAGTSRVSARDVTEAKRALGRYFGDAGHLHARMASVRWRFVLHRVDRDSDGTYYRLFIEPISGFDREDDRGRPIVSYRVPRNAVTGDPDDPSLVYRGMAWDEWRDIRRSCFVRSHGTLNIDQEGFTFFGRWSTALTYASDYAPLPFRPTAERPGVIIAIRRNLTISHADDPKHVPIDEWATHGSLSAAAIRGVWYVVPTLMRQGQMDLIVDRKGRVEEGRRSGPWAQYAVVEGDVMPTRTRCTSGRAWVENGNRRRMRSR